MSGVRRALIVLDGLGDLPHPDFGGRTPVEAAATPNLDRLLSQSASGEVVLLGRGIAPESDAGVLALLGYDPQRDSPGRGVLEALGVGLPLEPGDVALRLNFATTDGSGAVLDSRVGRNLSTAEAAHLARTLTDLDLLREEGVHAVVRETVGHRGVLWLHPLDGTRLSPEISNADPFYERVGGLGKATSVESPRIQPVRPLDDTLEAARTARLVARFLMVAQERLAGHSVNAKRALSGKLVANALLVRNAGTLPAHPPPSFRERSGVEGAAVTEMPVERGIARLLGMTDRYVGPMGPDKDAALSERARVTRELVESVPFVYVHLKGPDEPGHDGRAAAKKEVVEALDRSFFGPFLQDLDLGSVRVAVTADHSTPCIRKGHSDDPVPLLVAGAGFPPDPSDGSARKFSEREAARGRLGRLAGRDVMTELFRSEPAPPPV